MAGQNPMYENFSIEFNNVNSSDSLASSPQEGEDGDFNPDINNTDSKEVNVLWN